MANNEVSITEVELDLKISNIYVYQVVIRRVQLMRTVQGQADMLQWTDMTRASD